MSFEEWFKKTFGFDYDHEKHTPNWIAYKEAYFVGYQQGLLDGMLKKGEKFEGSS